MPVLSDFKITLIKNEMLILKVFNWKRQVNDTECEVQSQQKQPETSPCPWWGCGLIILFLPQFWIWKTAYYWLGGFLLMGYLPRKVLSDGMITLFHKAKNSFSKWAQRLLKGQGLEEFFRSVWFQKYSWSCNAFSFRQRLWRLDGCEPGQV